MWDTGELQHWAHKLGIGRPDRHRPARATAKACCRRRHWRNQLYKEGLNRPALVGGRQHPARHRPGRPADQPAADGDRLRGARQRRHRRHPARRPAGRRRGRPGAEGIRPQAAAPRPDRPRLPRPRSWKGCTTPRRTAAGTSFDVFGGFPIPVAGKTGTAAAAAVTPTSPGTRSLAPYPNPRIVTIVTMEEGGFGVESAAPAAQQILEAYFAKHACGRSRRRRRRRMSDVRDPRPPGPPRAVRGPRPASPSASACPTWTRRWRSPPSPSPPSASSPSARRPATTCPATPTTSSTARRSTPCLGIVGMFLLDPRSTTRASASCGSASTPSSASASRSSSSSASPPAARGAPSNCPSSASSHRSSASSCSCLRLPGSSSMAPGAARRAAHGALPLPRRSLPVPVILTRFAVPLWVLFLGMDGPFTGGTPFGAPELTCGWCVILLAGARDPRAVRPRGRPPEPASARGARPGRLLVGSDHHGHVAPILLRGRLDRTQLGHVLGEPLQQPEPQLGAGLLATAEHDGDLDLVATFEEAHRRCASWSRSHGCRSSGGASAP